MATADYAYLRLRDEGYTEQHIGEWADRVRDLASQCRDVFVYFKHEDEGKGPEFGRMLKARLDTYGQVCRVSMPSPGKSRCGR